MEKKKYLAKQGEEELLSLGERFNNYFPEIFQTSPADVSRIKYKVSFRGVISFIFDNHSLVSLWSCTQFKSTDLQRTIASMENFIIGLLGRDNTSYDAEVIPDAENTLLKVGKRINRYYYSRLLRQFSILTRSIYLILSCIKYASDGGIKWIIHRAALKLKS